MTPTIDLEREPWHGTLAGYSTHKCRCEDCRTVKRISMGDGYIPPKRYRIEKLFSPNVHPEYKSAERDPRVAPKPGDVFEKDGRIREITKVVIATAGRIIYAFKDSGDFIPTETERACGRPDGCSMPNFRKWVRDAKVLRVAQ